MEGENKFAYYSQQLRELKDDIPSKNTNSFLLNKKVLVLNQSYEPITVCDAKKAFLLLFLTKAEIVIKRKEYAIRSKSIVFPYPSVIRLSSYIRVPYKKVELSHKNILRRDNMQCQYCGTRVGTFTIDHIIPRSRGGSDTWENLTTACTNCNNKKGNRTPEEADMKLLSVPTKPNHILFLKQYMGTVSQEWRPFLFMD